MCLENDIHNSASPMKCFLKVNDQGFGLMVRSMNFIDDNIPLNDHTRPIFNHRKWVSMCLHSKLS